jgi:hypothetical protein
MNNLPPHPVTNDPAAFAVMFTEIIRMSEDVYRVIVLDVDIRGYKQVAGMSVPGTRNYGEAVPDFGFVLLNIRDVPKVRLATEPFSVRAGLDIATAGFPLGDEPLPFYGAVNQLTPFLRQGIISSVLPFQCEYQHGFTIDIMSQGGASGSPIFTPDDGTVVGILHAGFPGTNFTYAVPSHFVASALASILKGKPPDICNVPTMKDQIAAAHKSPEGTFGGERLA